VKQANSAYLQKIKDDEDDVSSVAFSLIVFHHNVL